MRTTSAPVAIAALLALGAACGDRRTPPGVPDDAAQVRRRDRQPGAVFPLPPYELRNDGVGPFTLAQPLGSVLYSVPAGPEPLDIENVVRLSIIRVEDGKIIVGGDAVVMSFVSVLAPDVARTDKGIEVGSTRAALDDALGEAAHDPAHVVDPRLLTYARLPNARFIAEDDKVRAIVLAVRPRHGVAGSAQSPACDRTAPVTALRSALGGEPAPGDCLSSTEVVAALDEDVVVYSAGDKPRRLAAVRVPGLVWAGAAHASKPEVIAVAVKRDARAVVWSVVVARLEAGKLVKILDEPAYQLTVTTTSWLGARLDELDLVLDVEARSDSLAVSGVMLHRTGEAIRLAAPLEPIAVPRRRRPPGDPTSSGSSDASVQPLIDEGKTADATPP